MTDKTTNPREPAPTTLLTLREISKRSGISYPTLQRYVKLHGAQIPSQGSDGNRRYPMKAIAVFEKLHAK